MRHCASAEKEGNILRGRSIGFDAFPVSRKDAMLIKDTV
jgi:hypothetical protein